MKRRTAAQSAALGLPVVVLVGALVVTRAGDQSSNAAIEPQQASVTVAAPTPEPTVTPTPKPKPKCTTTTKRFVPTSISIPGVDEKISVLPLPRIGKVPGTAPLTLAGKQSMAFDLGSGILPGDPAGNALLNAHTYPDGSALGNKLLVGLKKGDEIIVKGLGGQLCYKVNDSEVVDDYDKGVRYYAKTGKPQIAIIVCSGKRLGPGEWTTRTIWYASPISE